MGKFIVSGISLLVVLIVSGYLVSPVFQEKISSGYTGLTQWTPENISKNPTGYLNHCENKIDQAKIKLTSRRIELAQRVGQLKGMQESIGKEVEIGDKAIEELRVLYKKGEFPIEFAGRRLDKKRAEFNLIGLYKQLQAKKRILHKVNGSLDQLMKNVNEVEVALMQADQNMLIIQAQREEVKITSVTKEMTEQMASLNISVQSIVSVASRPDNISLSELVENKQSNMVEKNALEAALNG